MAVFKDDNKTKDNRSWYFKSYKKDFNGKNKAYKSKRYLTKKEAQEAEAIFILKRDNPVNKPFKLVAKDYLDYFKTIKKESTYYSYCQAYALHISPYFDKFNIIDINVSHIKEWSEILIKKNYSIGYLNDIYIILNNIFEYAVKFYGIQSNPAKIFGRFKLKSEDIIKDKSLKYITLEDFNKFISVIDDQLWKTFFIFLYYTGMRKGEVQALTWEDIDFTTKEITVNKTLTVKSSEVYKITSTKNEINRKIKMSKVLTEALLTYKKVVSQYTDFNENWFVFGNSRFLPQTTIYRWKDYYFKLSGVAPITLHEFRHSHVSLLISEYIKTGQTDTAKFFVMMSNRMGHSIEVMQRVYLHLFPDVQDEIVDILDKM